MVKSLRLGLGSACKDIESTLKKAQDKVLKRSAAEAKAAAKKAPRTPASQPNKGKRTNIFDFAWQDLQCSPLPKHTRSDLDRDQSRPYLASAEALMAWCEDNSEFKTYLGKFLSQARCLSSCESCHASALTVISGWKH